MGLPENRVFTVSTSTGRTFRYLALSPEQARELFDADRQEMNTLSKARCGQFVAARERENKEKRIMETRLVRLNGIPYRIPAEELPDPHSAVAPGGCFADEPGNVYGGAVCTLPPHATGPDGSVHIGHDGDGQVIAIWGDPAAVTGREL